MKSNPKKKDKPVIAANLGSVHMDISGNREVIFEGCKAVVEYSDTSIKLNTGKYLVCFAGRNLCIKCMTDCDLVVNGFITEIKYIM